MQTQFLKLSTILAWAMLFASGVSFAAQGDLVKLSGGWWGMSIQEFPKKAGLQPDEYRVMDHPSRSDVKVLMLSAKVIAKLEPAELPPLEFDFTTAAGLYEISGFIKGTPQEALTALTKRYGAPSEGTQVLGMAAYGWKFEKTKLDLRYNLFQLFPRKD
jgi:hypothetical protein